MTDQHLFHRKSIRLRGYDYSLPGGYFITINAHQKEFLFGKIQREKVFLNNFGLIVKSFWEKIPSDYLDISLDNFVIMPNHIHVIIFITRSLPPNIPHGDVRAGYQPALKINPPLPEIIRKFKTYSSMEINKLRKSPGVPVWQRNYYEHIIRNDEELNDIRAYIENNPANWAKDKDNPDIQL